MKITVFTLFPEMFAGPLDSSIIGRARQRGLIDIALINFRDYATSRHKNVDDEPFGGGAGMLLKPEPIYAAFEAVAGPKERYSGKVILLSPQGTPFSQRIASDLAHESEIALICGHYEGFDERIRRLADIELSIGDYVLTGGELPAMVIIDSVCRLIPGAIGEDESHRADSFSNGLLEHPHYTRPRVFRGMAAPDALISGDHERIRRWRRKESLRRTRLRRPDLLDPASLTDEDLKLLDEIGAEEDRLY